MTVTLTFHGAAGTVTGSHYLLEAPQARMALLGDMRRVLEKR